MKKILFYIYALPIYLLILLPFPALYLLSDIFFLIAFYVIGYRKKIVYANLKNAFPQKSEEEINTIMKKFYIFLCDIFVETFKSLTVLKKQVIHRYKFDDDSMQLALKYFEKNKSIIIVMGHFGQWEAGGQAFSVETPFQLFAIYHPLKNIFFDWLTNHIRSRVGTKMISMNNTVREMIKNKNITGAYAFIADQTPSNPKDAYWTNFLNQDTPIYWGTEILAKKFNYPVIFASVRMEKRGHYKIFLKLLSENPKETSEGEITEKHTRMLEQEIIKQPEIWLWSHRRWKHKRI